MLITATNTRRQPHGCGGAVVRDRASDIVVGGCEFESHHCHLTGHIPDQIMPCPLIGPTALDKAGTGLIIMCPMITMYSMCGCSCTTSTNKNTLLNQNNKYLITLC